MMRAIRKKIEISVLSGKEINIFKKVMEQLQENIENIEEFSRTNKEDFLHYIMGKYERLKM